jgi:hypothetical protein
VHLQEVVIQVAERRPVTLLAVIRVVVAAVEAVVAVVALPIVVVADRTNRDTRLLSSQIERLMYRPRRYDLLRNP